jgi:hypothetical protein
MVSSYSEFSLAWSSIYSYRHSFWSVCKMPLLAFMHQQRELCITSLARTISSGYFFDVFLLYTLSYYFSQFTSKLNRIKILRLSSLSMWYVWWQHNPLGDFELYSMLSSSSTCKRILNCVVLCLVEFAEHTFANHDFLKADQSILNWTGHDK